MNLVELKPIHIATVMTVSHAMVLYNFKYIKVQSTMYYFLLLYVWNIFHFYIL